MLHPDHQYDASAIPDLVRPILNGRADAVFGSRMLGGRPMEGGMPWQIIAQGMICNLTFQEVPIVTRYFPEASSISFRRSMVYGFGILGVLLKVALHKAGLTSFLQFTPSWIDLICSTCWRG